MLSPVVGSTSDDGTIFRTSSVLIYFSVSVLIGYYAFFSFTLAAPLVRLVNLLPLLPPDAIHMIVLPSEFGVPVIKCHAVADGYLLGAIVFGEYQ